MKDQDKSLYTGCWVLNRVSICHSKVMMIPSDGDDDVYYYIRWRLKLEGETENMCVMMFITIFAGETMMFITMEMFIIFGGAPSHLERPASTSRASERLLCRMLGWRRVWVVAARRISESPPSARPA